MISIWTLIDFSEHVLNGVFTLILKYCAIEKGLQPEQAEPIWEFRSQGEGRVSRIAEFLYCYPIKNVR